MTNDSALEIVESYRADLKVADLYDNEPELVSALTTLFPNFEYPDFSHLTIYNVLLRYNKIQRANN